MLNKPLTIYILLYALSCLIMIIPFVTYQSSSESDEIIVDSNLTFEQAIQGSKAPKHIIDSLVLIDVLYFSDDKKIHKGQVLINKIVEKDIRDIFEMMLKMQFTIKKVIPINNYNWSDEKSMEDNNTSAFNYRFISGTQRLSNHSFGRAVDINPKWNPVIYKDGKLSPKNGSYDLNRPGTFHLEHPVVNEFKSRKWRWGGQFNKYQDMHHFDFP